MEREKRGRQRCDGGFGGMKHRGSDKRREKGEGGAAEEKWDIKISS